MAQFDLHLLGVALSDKRTDCCRDGRARLVTWAAPDGAAGLSGRGRPRPPTGTRFRAPCRIEADRCRADCVRLVVRREGHMTGPIMVEGIGAAAMVGDDDLGARGRYRHPGDVIRLITSGFLLI